MTEPRKRCVNIDWLEVYVLESPKNYPMDADYFRRLGYFVIERDYGTRTYRQMFTIEDEHGNPWIEVRRDPASGASEFTGLSPESCHLRLTNRACYAKDAVEQLRVFMLTHGYIFQRIFRIDVCYDFEYFDSGDLPERFARRYIERKFRKINQCKLALYANDEWSDFEWESLKWGNEKSMVSTKLYNKSKELASNKNDKPYIRYAWFENNLVHDPVACTKKNAQGEIYKPDIWRVEFSMKSSARNWLVIEDQGGKKVKLKAIPHKLDLFDSRDKLWQRFEELAYHYFRFKYREFKKRVNSNQEPELKRKDLCRDKMLFDFRHPSQFMQLKQLPKASKPNHDDRLLMQRLQKYMHEHVQHDIQLACQTLIESLQRSEIVRLVEDADPMKIEALKRVIGLRLRYPDRKLTELAEEVYRLLSSDSLL